MFEPLCVVQAEIYLYGLKNDNLLETLNEQSGAHQSGFILSGPCVSFKTIHPVSIQSL